MKRPILHDGRFFPGLCILFVLLFAGEGFPQKTPATKMLEAGRPASAQSTYAQKIKVEYTPAGGSIHPGVILATNDRGHALLFAEGYLFSRAKDGLVRKVNSSGEKVWQKRKNAT